MRKWFALGCIVLGCVSALAPAIQARAEPKHTEIAGMVANCKGSIRGFKLLRAGRKGLQVKVFMLLYEGDIITAQTGNGVLTISFTDKHLKEVKKEDSPFTITAHGHPVSLHENVLAMMRWARKLQDVVTPTGVRRDEGKYKSLRWTVPLLRSGAARVALGERWLGVTWKGGKRPYHVTVKASDGETLLDERTEDREVLSIKPINLSSGRYRVLVTDGERKQLKGSFTVVEPSALPVTEAAPAWFPKGPARAFRAQELASKDKRRWCYEAYLSLIGLEEDFGVDGKDTLPARLRQEICY